MKKYTYEEFLAKVLNLLALPDKDHLSPTEIKAIELTYKFGRSPKVIVRSIQRYREVEVTV
jgi:hypothetical protein